MLVGFFANVAEWYDFSIYAFLATTMGMLFLNSEHPKIALIRAFFLFTVSYIARPIGSIFWGYYGDLYGRKKALKWCLILMAIPTVFIGILPTYRSIGIAASFSLFIFRVVQGFAAGGELPMSACYVYEIVPQEKKAFYCSVVAASPMVGVLLGSITSFFIYLCFTQKEILQYAWRIPFLFGVIVLFFILYIRRNIDETAAFKKEDTKNNTLSKYFFSLCSLSNLKKMFPIITLYIFIQSSFYLLFLWMPSYLNIFLSVSKNKSFLSNSIGIFSLVIFTVIVGYYADRIQYKKIIIFGITTISIMALPLFLLLQSKNFLLLIITQVFFAACLSCIDGVIINILVRGFSASTRCGSVNLAFTLPSTIFGGILPTLCSYLIYKTGFNLIPVLFLGCIGLMVLPVMVKSKSIYIASHGGVD